MSLDQATIVTAFNEEAGDAASLATTPEITRWFNEGQARLGRPTPKSVALAWAEGDISVALPGDFVGIASLDYDDNVTVQSFRVFGDSLVIDRSTGATAVGAAKLYYWAERVEVDGVTASSGTKQEDYACLYYALHRFFRKLSSNRALYKRYSTLLGANAVSMGDVQNESDRLYQDFIDARADLPPQQPAYYYNR